MHDLDLAVDFLRTVLPFDALDPEALRWWELFSSVKGQAIWISSGREYQTGKNQDPVLALSGWWLMNAQDRAALETLGKLA